ncbi:hypothetical protein ACVJBD_002065 [Rhizobium mongolense]
MEQFNHRRLQAPPTASSRNSARAAPPRVTPPDPVVGGDPVEKIVQGQGRADGYTAREIDGTVIQAGDVQVYISSAGLAIAPAVGDLVVTANGKQDRVVNGDPKMTMV